MTTGVGTGASVEFTTTTGPYSGDVTSFTVDGEEIPVIDMATLSDTGYRKKVFGKLKEPPQITVNINYNPADKPPIGTEDTITITWPDSSTLTGTGAFISRSAETPLEDKMTGTFVFQMDGQTGPTFTDGTNA